MTTDLWALVFVALWTLPLVYVPPFGKMRATGMSWGMGNRSKEPDVPEWVKRAERAARNHLENLPLFAVVVLVAHVSGERDGVTAAAAVGFAAARVLHSFLYWFGITALGVRTGAYYLSIGCLLVMVSRLF